MRRRAMVLRAAALAAMVGAGGCAVGPSYRPTPVVPAESKVGVAPAPDSVRAFFDSLAAQPEAAPVTPRADTTAADTAGAADTAAAPAPAIAVQRPLLEVDSVADLAWLEVLQDTVLVRLVETALRENRDVQEAMARLREFRAQVGVARSGLFPTVTVNGAASTNQVALGALAPMQFDAFRITADLQWELDLWGRTRRGLQAAQADYAAQEADRRAVLLTLISDVATAYLELLELDQEVAIAERALASRQATLALARQRFERGVISALDVRQFESDVAVPAATLAQARRLRAQKENELAVLLGRMPSAIPRGRSLAEAVRVVSVPDSVPSTLLARRPDVRRAERAYAAAVARIGVADAARLPSFSITANYGTQSPNTAGLFGSNGEIYQLQGGVSIPLFTGGRLLNEARVARARAEQARAQYERTVLEALREAGDALVGVRTARDQRVAQAAQVRALREAYELAQLRYETGVASYLEVLDAQRGLFSAELALSQTQLLELAAAVQLYKALGGSWTVE